MVSRPYFRSSFEQLLVLFNNNRTDLQILRQLQEELKHRKTPKAMKLSESVNKEIVQLDRKELGIKNFSTEEKSQLDLVIDLELPQQQQGSSKQTQLVLPINQSTNENERYSEKKSNPVTTIITDQDDVPQKMARGIIRKPGCLTDVPEKWVFPEKTDLKVPVNQKASLIVKYQAALKVLIYNMKKKGVASSQVILENGKYCPFDVEENCYQFPYNGDKDFFEDAPITAIIGKIQVEGKIVNIGSDNIIISINNDFGTRISKCVLFIDNTAVLEALRIRFEKIGKGDVKPPHFGPVVMRVSVFHD